MTVSRLRHIPGIGVDVVGDAADAAADPEILRLENLDTDLRPPQVAVTVTRAAIDDDAANSYLPFPGHLVLREAAAAHVGRLAGRGYNAGTECVVTAGGLNGILNALLATVEPGQEVVLCDPVYAGLVNRVLLAGGVPRFVTADPGPGGWSVDPEQLAAAVGPATAAVPMMGPCMPTGLVLDDRHWSALAAALERHPAWLVYDAAMERISKWLPGWKRNGWKTADRKPVKNADLWRRLDAAVQRHDVDWRWVRGHAGNAGNERADALANRGMAEAIRHQTAAHGR
jgi:aspartate/methionine/tyrosine aminotransferase